MANNLGSLRVSLGLDAAEFTAGLTKAEYQARKFGEQLGGGIRSAGMLAAGALAAVGLSAAGAVAGFQALINGVGDFQDLAEKTGASAEGLASFGVAAGTAGTTVAAIAEASNKLTKNLIGVDDESKAAGAAIAALGLNLKEFKELSPEARIEALSKALDGFEDGPNKAAVAMALLGKSGAELLPFLKTLEEQGGRQVILTAEQIAQADEYADKQAQAKAELLQYAQALATQTLPSITAFTGALSDTAKEMLGVGKEANSLKGSTAVADFADSAVGALGFIVDAGDGVVRVFSAIGKTIGAAAAQTAAVANGEFAQALNIGKEWQKDMAAIADQELFSTKLQRRIAAARTGAGSAAPGEPRKPLRFEGANKPTGNGAGEAAAKKALDNQLKAYENSVKEEEDILRSRNRMLDLYNNENLLSTADYFAGKRTAQEEAVNAKAALYDKEIAALQAYQSKAGKATDREATQGKINDLTAKKTALYREAGQAAIEMGFAETKAAQNLGDQLSGVNADVLELTGNLTAASKNRFDQQYKDLINRLTANGDTAGLRDVDRLKQLKTAQAEIGQQTSEISRITEGLRIEEERIAIARQLGATGELESLGQLGTARQSAIKQLEGIVVAYEAIAAASGNPVFLQNADRARLELQKLSSVADPLADKFKTLFTDSLGNELADFITGTKSAEDAIKGFSRTVINELSNIAAKNFASSLTSSIFGSGGGASGGGFWSSIFGSIFGRAQGGMVQSGGLYEVNENGPEMLSMGGKSYLMAGGNGAVSPMDGKLSSNAGTMGDVILNITTPAGTAVTKSNQRQQGNNRVMEVMIEQVKGAVANDIAQGGQVATALQGTYGLNRGAGTARRG